MTDTTAGQARTLAALPVLPRPRLRPGWARPDPIDRLARELDEFAAAAVHPDEIAALLESDGLSDEQIRERYGVPDSFALAERLYDRTPRRHPEPAAPPPEPWHTGLLGCLLRGLLFALPGFAYVLGAPFPSDPRALLAGALCGWAWNQGLAHRAYSWLGLGDPAAARRCLLTGTPAGMLLGTLTALAVTGPGHPGTIACAAAQSCYLGASSALLVMGRERVLLAALLPLTAGGLLAPFLPLPGPWRSALLLTSLAAVAVLGLREVRPKGPRQPGDRAATTGPRPVASLPYALFGLATGTLVLHTSLSDPRTAVALTLSMGPAEHLLHRFRTRARSALRTTDTPQAFRRSTARALARCLAAYLAPLLVPALFLPRPQAAGLLALGAVLWTGLLLQSFGAVLGATAVCGAAALAQTLALPARTGHPHTVALAVYAAAALAQSALACGLLGRVTAHR
ncbi:hypothetical protein ACWCV9_10565 [Streptomyces sp. NPDC001606]